MANQLSTDTCARELLDVVPEVVQFIRAEMRVKRSAGLSIPLFRAMVYLSRNSGASLSMLADHLGLSPAGTSTVADGLVERGFLRREEVRDDRRMIALSLTDAGRRNLVKTREAVLVSLSARLDGLDQEHRRGLMDTMACLRSIFVP